MVGRAVRMAEQSAAIQSRLGSEESNCSEQKLNGSARKGRRFG